MIFKPREMPLYLQKLQALERRIPRNHRMYSLIKESYAKYMAGYKGELALDYHLSLLSEDEFYILHDLRLQYDHHFFQMDTVIIHERFIIMIEAKNIIGSLLFDQEFKQLVRTYEGEEVAFPDPVMQVQDHQKRLHQWMKKKKFPEIPLIPLVIITNPQSVIRSTTTSLKQSVLHKQSLPEKIRSLQKQYSETIYSQSLIKKLAKALKQSDTPLNTSVLERFQIRKEELLTGIHCPNCFYLPLERCYGTWYCPNCKQKTKDAFKHGVRDFSLLINENMTNREIREFLQIPSQSLTTRLLQSLQLPSVGEKKNRVYQMNANVEP